MIADIAISLFPGSLRSPEVLLTWLQLQNITVAKGSVCTSLMERKTDFSMVNKIR